MMLSMAHRPPRDGARATTAPPTTRSVLLRYALGTAAATIVIVVGGTVVLRSVAIDEAKRDTRTKVLAAGQIVESALADGLLDGDEEALAAIDDAVLGRVLSGSVVRVKIWSQDGRVLYSDDPAQIGGRYALDADQRRLLLEGGAEVEVSALDRPENARDRGQGELIEAYTPIRTPSGTPVLFEIYERLDSVTAGARRLLAALAPPILGAIALLVLVQVPLVWSLIRGLQRGHEDREALLANAILEAPLGHLIGRPAADQVVPGLELNFRHAGNDHQFGAIWSAAERHIEPGPRDLTAWRARLAELGCRAESHSN